jgi:hypothetical protein
VLDPAKINTGRGVRDRLLVGVFALTIMATLPTVLLTVTERRSTRRS